MVWFPPRLLTILTAAATALAGIPSFATGVTRPDLPGPHLCPAPFDTEDPGESRGPDCSEEREEKEQEEDGDGTLHLFAGDLTVVRHAARSRDRLAATAPVAARRFAGPTLSIRGPPAR